MEIEETKLISIEEKDIDKSGHFVVPEVVTVIAEGVFGHCDKLISIDFKNVEFVCRYAFKHCNNLKSLYFKNVKKIGNSAFYRCTSLEKINLKNVEFIVSWAFGFCVKLKEIINLKYVARIQENAFNGCLNMEVNYV